MDTTDTTPVQGLASLLNADDIETALVTLAELWARVGPTDDLSERQQDVADHVASLRDALDGDDPERVALLLHLRTLEVPDAATCVTVQRVPLDADSTGVTSRVLEMSPDHLQDPVYADLNGVDGVVADRVQGGGWLLWVPSDPAAFAAEYDGDDSGVPDAVLGVQTYARAQGADHILIRDGLPRIEALPVLTLRGTSAPAGA